MQRWDITIFYYVENVIIIEKHKIYWDNENTTGKEILYSFY